MIEDIKITSKLLNDFRNYESKRSSFFMSYNVLPKILEWHIEMWRKEVNLLGKGNETLDLWSQYSQLYHQLDSIFSDITTKMLTENTMDTYSFFNLFSKHINKYKEEKIKVNESYHYYIEYLFRNFFRIFFEKINLAPDKYNIWEHYFPPTLKIHSVTVVSDLLQRAVFNEYFQWAEGRIGRTNKKKEFDESLDDVSEHLFPEIDPTLWAEILTFIFSPYLPNGHLKYFIEQDQIIFGSARFRSYGGYIENDKDFQKKAQELWGASAKSERKNTIKMVITLFGQIFTEKNLIDLIKQGESLNYTSEPEKENRKNILVDIFRELLNYQQSKKNANQY